MANQNIRLSNLKNHQQVVDFTVEAVYEVDNQNPLGARFRHNQSGFVLDLLRIQSVPQAFMWVNSHPVSDRGEPHTLEHLLLGKGTKGRYVASLEEMSLGNSSAFTAQLRTCYHFHTPAGGSVFFNLFQIKLDAMLHPNFSDEEIRREVRNMGITNDPVDGSLSLEEKGTVYNEMISSFERPWGNLYFELGKMIYDHDHPSAYSAGGYPTAIREMKPVHIRNFHNSTHHLNNMGAIMALPSDISLKTAIVRISDILKIVEPEAKYGNVHPDDANNLLSIPDGKTTGTLSQVTFPHMNKNEPGLLVFSWPANRTLDSKQNILLDLFVQTLASGQTSNLYRRFIDSQTQIMDIGATSVFGWRSDEAGEPIFIGLNSVHRKTGDAGMMDSIRQVILDEIQLISNYSDGSDELSEFNKRIESRIEKYRKEITDFLNSPPRFGYRGTGSSWMKHLSELHKIGGFKRSLTFSEYFDWASTIVKSNKNHWREMINNWKLLNDKPFGVVTLPDPGYLEQKRDERDLRIEEYKIMMMERYQTNDIHNALLNYQEDYDGNTAVIEKVSQTINMPKFIDQPPFTLDDQLDYSIHKMPGGGDLVYSRFDNITGATIGLALNLHVVPESLLVSLSALPVFMAEVGVQIDGTIVTYNKMEDMLRRELLRFDIWFATNERTKRIELVVEGAGSTLEEAKRTLVWMEAVLKTPNLQETNLARIRDAIDLNLSNLRNRMHGSEESWVKNPAKSFRMQDHPLFLSTESFLTKIHSYQRLRWQLKEIGREEQNEFTIWIASISDYAQKGRKNLLKLLENKILIPENINELAQDALQDLKLNLTSIPDETLEQDWRYLCEQFRKDLFLSPKIVLTQMKTILETIVHQDNVRGYIICSKNSYEELDVDIFKFVSNFSSELSIVKHYTNTPFITKRMQDHYPEIKNPKYVGLVNISSSSGVHINTAPCASFVETKPEVLLDFLSARLYGGGGAHSMFMKTWGAGLAYSNGLRSNEYSGQLIYYAERCPDLSQTMDFVVQTLKEAPFDPSLSDYAVAQAFSVNRAGDRYEIRGRDMAADLADGLTPEIVSQFRKGVMKLRARDDLYDTLHSRMESIYGRVLPGYGPKAQKVDKAQYFVIAPENMLQTYGEYLQSTEGKDGTLYRLYLRDYWLVD